MKKHIDYYCPNGAWHSWPCSDTCWNHHPQAQKYEDHAMDKRFNDWLDKKRKREKIARAMRAGFTKSQAEYLAD